VRFFWIRKKVHWGDCDAARIVWFPRFLEWFEEAEEELYVALGQPRQELLDRYDFGMPRVELHTTFHAPARAGQIVRVGLRSRVENLRRIRHEFEIRDDASNLLLVSGFVRVGCIDWSTFTPRDLPEEVIQLLNESADVAEKQSASGFEIPWT
jgi:acyl-CoA thioester hydrolase